MTVKTIFAPKTVCLTSF